MAATAISEVSATEVAEADRMSQKEKTIQMPLFEGHRVNEHRLNFVGNVPLVDAELVKDMKLGSEFEIVIRGKVSGRNHKAVTDKEGNKLGAVSSSTLYIESVSAYDPD